MIEVATEITASVGVMPLEYHRIMPSLTRSAKVKPPNCSAAILICFVVMFDCSVELLPYQAMVRPSKPRLFMSES